MARRLTLLLTACAALLTACEDRDQKLDRYLAWHEVDQPYPVANHGVCIGEMTVPGHTQRVTFFLWGIAKEDYLGEDDEPKIFGEMDLDGGVNRVNDGDLAKLAELDRIALEAYNHGSLRVVLTKHKAYAVSSVEEEEAWDIARRANEGGGLDRP